MDNLVSRLMGDEIVDEQVDGKCQLTHSVYINGTEHVDNPALIVMNATYGESQKLHKQALTQTKGLFETLREIHDRKAYLHLNCLSFRDYMKKLKQEAGYLEIEERAFLRQLAQRKVAATLSAAGVDTRNLTQQQSALLNKLSPELQPEIYKKAQERSNEEPPAGKAGEFHHPGKVYLNKLEEVIAEVQDPFEGLNDPPEEADESPTRPDFFDNRMRAESAKPLPPPVVPPTEEEPDLDEECYVYAGWKPSDTPGIVFLFGDDGLRRAVIPLRLETIKEILHAAKV